MKIEIIGSIDGKPHFSENHIASLLQKDPSELKYGNTFMGRPGTRLYVGEKEIVKLRSELELNLKNSRAYINNALEQEKKIQFYHPYKTWFLYQLDNNKIIIANICPRLTPLHKLVNIPDALST